MVILDPIDEGAWEEDWYHPGRGKPVPSKRRKDEVDEDALKEAYEHLMSGEGWVRLNCEIPALRKKDYIPGGDERYEKITNRQQARTSLRKQEMTLTTTWDGTNLVSSQCSDGYHRLAIDVDRKCEVLVSDFTDAVIVVEPFPNRPPQPVALKGNVFRVDSSSEDHFHLYSDHPMTWGEYTALLEKLGRAGVIAKSYYLYSVERGFTAVRKPWIRKVGR